MRLRTKLTLGTVCLVALLTLLVVFAVKVDMEKSLRKELHAGGLSTAKYLAEDVTNPLLDNKFVTVQDIIDTVEENEEGIEYIYVADFDGNIVAHTFQQGFPTDLLTANPLPPNKQNSVRLLSTEEGLIDDIAVPLIEGMGGELHIGVSEGPIEKSVSHAVRKILSIAALILLFGIGLAFLFTTTITRPIQRLVNGAEKIGRGDLDHEIKIDSRDEIGELASSFNRMTLDLKEKDQQLRGYTEHLEDKVEERTKELLLIQKINTLLNVGASQDEIFKTITEGLTSVYKYRVSVIYLLNEESTHLICKGYSASSKIVKKAEKLTGITALNYAAPLYEESLLSKVIETQKPVITSEIVELIKNHTDKKELKLMAKSLAKIVGIKFGIGVPLLAGNKVSGIIGVGCKRKLSGKDVDRLTSFAEQVGLTVEKVRMEQRLKGYSERLEQKVEEKIKEVTKTKGYLASIVDGSMDAIVSIDLEGTIKSWNKGAEQIFGYRAEEIIGSYYYKIVPEELREEVEKVRREVFEKGFIRNYETFRLHKGGRSIPVNLTITAIKDADGKIIGTSGILKDLSEKKELERQLLRSERLATLGQLAAGVAHEINNPLSAISMDAEMVLKNVKKDLDKQRLREIVEQTEAVAKITQSLLEFARQRESKFVLVNVNEEVSKALKTIDRQFAKIEVIKDLDSDLPEITADPLQLQQVFVNIITNAVQAMADGGRLTVTTENKNGWVEAKIADTGPGLSQEHISRIFDPFFTTKPVGKGTGLGLSICYGIVQAHSGTIEVESEEGRGSTFIIKLPIV